MAVKKKIAMLGLECANLLVRVGGFPVRFIGVDSEARQEILSRTEHGA